jgi:hypothetical protein
MLLTKIANRQSEGGSDCTFFLGTTLISMEGRPPPLPHTGAGENDRVGAAGWGSGIWVVRAGAARWAGAAGWSGRWSGVARAERQGGAGWSSAVQWQVVEVVHVRVCVTKCWVWCVCAWVRVVQFCDTIKWACPSSLLRARSTTLGTSLPTWLSAKSWDGPT